MTNYEGWFRPGWFALMVRTRTERAVAYELIERGFATYLPVEHRIVTHARKKTRKPYPLLPGYVLVEIGAESDFARARHPDARKFLLSASGRPARADDGELERLRDYEAAGLCDREPELRMVKFNKGDTVKILDGPFAGLHGTVEKGGEAKSFAIITALFGRATRLTLDAIHLKAA